MLAQAEREAWLSQDYVNSQLQKFQDLPARKQVGIWNLPIAVGRSRRVASMRRRMHWECYLDIMS